MNTPIKQASRHLSDLIHGEALWPILESDRDRLSRITAARDVTEDADWALRGYPELHPDAHVKLLYLATYGALQALYIQTVAIRELCGALEEVFGLPRIHSRKNFRAREGNTLRPRHQVAGHPVDQTSGRLGYYGIAHPTLCHGSFMLVHWDKMLGDKRSERLEEVDLASLIEDQQEWALGVLQAAVRAVEREASRRSDSVGRCDSEG